MHETWIIPINPKYFDIRKHLQQTDNIAVKKIRPIKRDDVVYIYLAAPYSQIKYSGVVVNEECAEDDLINHEYVKSIKKSDNTHFFLIKVTQEFKEGTFGYEELKANDIGQVQTMARASRRLKKYLLEKDCEVSLI